MITLPCCLILFLTIGKTILGDNPPGTAFEAPIQWPETFEAPIRWPDEDVDIENIGVASPDGPEIKDTRDAFIDETKDTDNIDEETERHRRAYTSHDYKKLLEINVLFFEAQRSGKEPDSNRVKWRADSALDDIGEHNENLTGGWYDAGDNIKFNLPMAYSASVIGYGLILYKDAYKDVGHYKKSREEIRWACDYFIRCHPKPNEYYYQVGYDHTEWQRPEDMLAPRTTYKIDCNYPGSDVAAASSAALSTCAIVWKSHDAEFAEKCENASKSLYTFAMNEHVSYPSELYYASSIFADDLAWAAGLLHLATGNQTYLDDAEAIYDEYRLFTRSYAFGWGDVREIVKVLLWRSTADEKYKKHVLTYLDVWMPGGGMEYTAGGLAFRNSWGSLRYSSATAFIALAAVESGLDTDSRYAEFACNQINYILGDNPTNQSYVVGYGNNSPKRPHHRASSCPKNFEECTTANSFGLDGDNPNVLTGALVGGPDEKDWWEDSRYDYIQNEVACDYNAGFQSAIAGLKQLEVHGILPNTCLILPSI